MASNFHVTVRVWSPDRFTVVFAPRVKTRPVVLQLAVSAAQVAISLKAESLSVPDAPVPPVQEEAFQVTSAGAHVAANATGG